MAVPASGVSGAGSAASGEAGLRADAADAAGTAAAVRYDAVRYDAAETIGTCLDGATTCRELAAFLVRHRVCEAAAVELLPEDVPDVAAVADVPDLAAVPDVTNPPDPPHPPDPPDRPGSPDRPGAPAAGRGGPLLRAATAGRPELLPPHAPRDMCSAAVPLTARGRRYGELIAVRTGGAFTAEEADVLRYAAQLAAVHLGHARRHEAVRAAAANLQRALLAEPGRPHANLDIATHYLPAGGAQAGGDLVGGDWVETVRLHFGRTLLVMGDVMGHGLDAAVDMSAYRSLLRYVASTDLPPHRVLRRLDAAAADDGKRRPATCLLARVDPARGAVSLVSAGHLPPVVFGPDGRGRLLELPVGPPLGTGIGGYEATTCALAPGETLVMFTDGLVERRREDIDVSLARLAGLALPPGAAARDTLDFILDHLDAQHAEDDVAVLAARIHRNPPDQDPTL
ncbi:PP2C family protein-serine/threonine phosphatase [Streptomyces sp. HPF1205]|uniref:PP2C family protein-serine/threonine phosphatase n=1 Tax=Streptomyces sp. HPF1205 TaxID=2873262 RepID=UPI001CEC8D59|nr:GAF domain-containing SpoIIE family protein phosphatase [Streptomyces sp. HPF1205]